MKWRIAGAGLAKTSNKYTNQNGNLYTHLMLISTHINIYVQAPYVHSDDGGMAWYIHADVYMDVCVGWLLVGR